MPHNFFLSHYSKDEDVAKIIAKSLSMITVDQIIPWYSSDSSESGGLKPGNIWFNEILSKIQQSKVVVVILTPNSINRPWLYFESGMAQSLEECEVIPVCVGTKRDSVSAPLGMYQCYQLTDYKSLRDFFGKLLAKFGITFYEEMAKNILEKAITDLSKITFELEESENDSVNIDEKISELKTHIDKRFVELLDKTSNNFISVNSTENSLPEETTSYLDVIYTITIDVRFPEFKGKQFLEIRSSDTVQDVLNNMYFLLGDYIRPFTYMEKWILKHPKTEQRLIIREIARMIPAKFVFHSDIEWQAIKLQKEYKASDSKEIVRST